MPESVDSTQLNRREKYRALGEHPGCLEHLAHQAQGEKPKNQILRKLLVRKGGLEPPRLTAPDPKSGASANSATFARFSFNSLPAFSNCCLVTVGEIVGVFPPSPLSRLVAQNLSTSDIAMLRHLSLWATSSV
jgi:hypothetical protein